MYSTLKLIQGKQLSNARLISTETGLKLLVGLKIRFIVDMTTRLHMESRFFCVVVVTSVATRALRVFLVIWFFPLKYGRQYVQSSMSCLVSKWPLVYVRDTVIMCRKNNIVPGVKTFPIIFIHKLELACPMWWVRLVFSILTNTYLPGNTALKGKPVSNL